jgi:hypothetical protein
VLKAGRSSKEAKPNGRASRRLYVPHMNRRNE